MADETRLKDDGGALVLTPRLTLRTPGLSGRVRVHEGLSDGMRGAEATRESLLEALRRNDVTETLTVEIREPAEHSRGSGSRARGSSDDMVLEVRDPGEGFARVVLYESEDGVVSWHFPEEGGAQERATRGGNTLTFRVPREVSLGTPDDDPGQRGILGAVGTKILKVLTFRLIQEGARIMGGHFARKLEDGRRPHHLRRFGPGDYTATNAVDLTTGDLRSMAAGRTLLLLHGTFSTAHSAFGTLPLETVRALHHAYDGRVIALDHPTVSVRPDENAAWLGDHLRAAAVRLEVDILAHSRGGLVGRVLAERADLSQSTDLISVGRLAMVATPNAGTALADVAHLQHLLNRYTTLLQLVPDNGITDVLDVVLAIVKQVAVGVLTGMDGLMSMNPTGAFLTKRLNRPGRTSTTYFAAAANFDPPQGSKLLRIARDNATDMVFQHVSNDLVVPTEGVFAVPGAGTFPVVDPLIFDTADAVDHSGFWTQQKFNKHLLEWLPG